MKTNRKKFLSLLMVMMISISAMAIPAYATEVTSIDTKETVNELSVTPRSGDVLRQGGNLYNESICIPVTIPKATTYTITVSARQITGNNGLWAYFVAPDGSRIFDKIILNGTYQERYVLSAGTYYLNLGSSPYNITYAAVIGSTYE